MIKIVLTGGIGTGKTHLSKHFIEMGIPVFYADEEAKKLYSEPEVIRFFSTTFGDIVLSDGKIDFKKLSDLIFSDEKARAQVNQYIHPLLFEHFNQWGKKQKCNIIMMESAIIFEAGLDHHFDKIIVVDSPMGVRLERIRKKYPHWSEDEIRKRIATQLSQEEKCKRADLILLN